MIEEAQSKGKKVGGSIECIVIHFTCLKSDTSAVLAGAIVHLL